ncbi:MAG: 5'/3'-nucleotidase SurE [Bacteroidales bacterium]|nr:5'/3'-nucleotidase SurE [Bacteroidales bacterium]
MDIKSSQKPLILVSNDDGIEAPGLMALVDALTPLGDVVAVAPDDPQSGKSSAITVGAPLHITQHPDAQGARVFSVSGTPVDCVKLAMHTILPRRPDFVFAGINHGSNSGTAITYSGTMGAVLEGCMDGIPSVGFSLLHHSLKADFSMSLPLVKSIAADVVAHGLPHWTALNVNIPALIVPKGVRVCRAAKGHWSEEYKRYLDPSGNPFFWLTGRFVNMEPNATDTDEYWLGQKYISIVPVTPDQTVTSAIPEMATRFDVESDHQIIISPNHQPTKSPNH